MAGVRKMNVSCDGNIVTVDGVKDFRLSQILECGQCFHFDKLDDEVYEVIAFGRAVKMEQSGACSGYMVHPWRTMMEYGALIWIWTMITASSRRVS